MCTPFKSAPIFSSDHIENLTAWISSSQNILRVKQDLKTKSLLLSMFTSIAQERHKISRSAFLHNVKSCIVKVILFFIVRESWHQSHLRNFKQIQISIEICLLLVFLIHIIQSQRHFAHTKTAQLSCYEQNVVVNYQNVSDNFDWIWISIKYHLWEEKAVSPVSMLIFPAMLILPIRSTSSNGRQWGYAY